MISQKRLEAAFPGKGKELRELLTKQRKTTDYKSVRDWISKCYNMPRYQERLEVAVNEVLGGYGSEAIFGGGVRPAMTYVNMGDTYITTLIYDYRRGSWLISSWGDWIEREERRGRRYA